MKYLVLLLLSAAAHAESSFEVIGGSLTYHVIDTSGRTNLYSNKVSTDGRLIANPILGFQYTDQGIYEYQCIALFTGQDSVGGPIFGAKYSSGFRFGNWYVGYVLGAYEQNDKGYDNLGIVPFQVAKTGNTGVVPVLGVEADYKIVLSRDTYVKLNNIISPVITNTTISLGVSY